MFSIRLKVDNQYHRSGILPVYQNKIKEKIDFALNETVNEKFVLQENACYNCNLKNVCKIEDVKDLL